MLVQDIYFKRKMVEDQMKTRSGFWKFFHPSKVNAYNSFMEETETILQRVDFKKENIAQIVKHYASSKDHGDDKGHLKEFFVGKKQELEGKQKGHKDITPNVVRFNNARNEELKTHALQHKMEKITSKYPGMTTDCPSLGLLKEKNKEYDNAKNKEGFKEIARQIYWGFYTEILGCSSADNFNLKEAMHDANKLTLLVMNKYTPIYEDPELADILPDLSFGTMSAEVIERATKKNLNSDASFKDEAQAIIDEYKNSDNVKQDKLFLGVYKESINIIEQNNDHELAHQHEENKKENQIKLIN